MTIHFPCGQCGHRNQVPMMLAGKMVPCTQCGAGLKIPVPRQVPPRADESVLKTFDEVEAGSRAGSKTVAAGKMKGKPRPDLKTFDNPGAASPPPRPDRQGPKPPPRPVPGARVEAAEDLPLFEVLEEEEVLPLTPLPSVRGGVASGWPPPQAEEVAGPKRLGAVTKTSKKRKESSSSRGGSWSFGRIGGGFGGGAGFAYLLVRHLIRLGAAASRASHSHPDDVAPTMPQITPVVQGPVAPGGQLNSYPQPFRTQGGPGSQPWGDGSGRPGPGRGW